jgi:broad specificity phosphatase PhoE
MDRKIRHAESEKNLNENFDGDASLDLLTSSGRQKTDQISKLLKPLFRDMSVKIYCANSGRAKETSAIILGGGNQTTQIIEAFGSMKSGPFAGLNDTELAKRYPVFFQDLQLFRAGVLSGYKVRAPEGAEKWKDFEEKIIEAIQRIDSDPFDLKIIVCHRSAMIALFAYFARRLLAYPEQHLGFANVPPLYSALIRPDDLNSPFVAGSFNEVFASLESSIT